MSVNNGDIVKTVKGCRIKGCPYELKVIDNARKWGNYDACVCEKPDGSKRLFLTKNLRQVKKEDV